jgi:hypothetical protein
MEFQTWLSRILHILLCLKIAHILPDDHQRFQDKLIHLKREVDI